MLPPKMKALVFEAAGTARDMLRVRQVDVPEPAPGEALVRVDARPIQPADLMFISNRYRIKPQFPQIAGLEGTGLVVAVGPKAAIEVGTRVAFRHPGSWAEYAAVPERLLYRVPNSIPIEAAAQFAVNPITAYALLDVLNLQSGDWIAINAATSSVARLVAGLARLRGINVLGLVRPGTVESPGFPMLAMGGPALAAAALAFGNGRPFAGLLDSIGGPAIKDMLPALRQGATVVSFGLLGTLPVHLFNADMIFQNLSWKGFGLDHWLSTSRHGHPDMVDEIWRAVQDGDAPLPVRARHPLEDVMRALDDASSPGQAGKVLLIG